ncbi:SAM-dependent methyltransferase [Actinoalloteichus hoggarensis]|uniref:class I SAM-dependent methyltransferase n=1 Tax=Actinoalloteichus hoggarensis TaxID=1470176 RepID=UPI0017CD1819|nr:class I SAM-dependent methyltransferase [Actinoalloteichus hoggarensis]MBB5923529.1 SAM-dependent methyltransferase [Actinoalloteichus hoggarensis]
MTKAAYSEEVTMTDTPTVGTSNTDQFRSWDGDGGAFWTERADRFDQGMAGYHGGLLTAADIQRDSAILDIGCGSGQVTRDAARIAQDGSALGVDLSSTLLSLARALTIGERLTNATFVQADAQIHDFGESRFDVALSADTARCSSVTGRRRSPTSRAPSEQAAASCS